LRMYGMPCFFLELSLSPLPTMARRAPREEWRPLRGGGKMT
jgi:hypothetical protein